jgi:hypothetical protein
VLSLATAEITLMLRQRAPATSSWARRLLPIPGSPGRNHADVAPARPGYEFLGQTTLADTWLALQKDDTSSSGGSSLQVAQQGGALCVAADEGRSVQVGDGAAGWGRQVHGWRAGGRRDAAAQNLVESLGLRGRGHPQFSQQYVATTMVLGGGLGISAQQVVEAHQFAMSSLVQGLDSDQLLGQPQRGRIVAGLLVPFQQVSQRLQVEPPQPLSLQESPVVVETVEEGPLVKGESVFNGSQV